MSQYRVDMVERRCPDDHEHQQAGSAQQRPERRRRRTQSQVERDGKQGQSQHGDPGDESHLKLASISVPALSIRQDAPDFGEGALQVELFVDAQQGKPNEEPFPEPMFGASGACVRLLPFAQQPPYGPSCNHVQKNGQPSSQAGVSDTRRPVDNKTMVQRRWLPSGELLVLDDSAGHATQTGNMKLQRPQGLRKLANDQEGA